MPEHLESRAAANQLQGVWYALHPDEAPTDTYNQNKSSAAPWSRIWPGARRAKIILLENEADILRGTTRFFCCCYFFSLAVVILFVADFFSQGRGVT